MPGQYLVAPGSYPGQAGPYTFDPMLSSETTQDSPTAPAPEGSKKQKVLRLVAAGVITLVVAVAVLLLWGSDGGQARASASASASRVAAVETVVRGYLQAIARGDASRALDYLAEKPHSTELLTDDVLAASREAATLTSIDVRARSSAGDTIDVKASYRLGDAGVNQTFTVTQHGGSWKIVVGTATVDLAASAGDLPLAINGQPVSDSSAVVLFPGSYAVTMTGDTQKYITLATTTFQVTDLGTIKPPAISATLTDEGVAAFRQAVRTSVETCAASVNLDSGCQGSGLDVPAEMDGTSVTEGTVVRTLSPELVAELDTLVPRLSGSNPAVAYAAPAGLVDIAVTGTRDGQPFAGSLTNTQTGQPGFRLGVPQVDMTDPALPVTWSGR